MLIRPGGVVVVGLRREAALLPKGMRAVVSGARPERLKSLMEALPGDVTAVLSFGFAGGLKPGLPPGRLVVATALDPPDIAPDPLWAALIAARTGAARGTLASSDTVLDSPEAKRRLHEATGALAVDMESGVAARFAAARGLPFAALRAISDSAEEALPASAADAITPEGGINLPGLLRMLIWRRDDLRALTALGPGADEAETSLRMAVERLH